MSGSESGRGGAVRHRLFDLAAMACIGVVIVAAALVPAFTANTGGTTTIRGDVRAGGQVVPFVDVGFWSPTGGVLASAEADSGGRFTLDVPDAVDGYAFAGAAPDAYDALSEHGGRMLVRGIIGAKAASPISTPLFQGWAAATAKNLAGGAATLHFALEEAGRITGHSPVTGSRLQAVQVRRLDGSVVQKLAVDRRGNFTSKPLVPGTYAVAVLPTAPSLPEAVQVAVPSGGTAKASLPAPTAGATIRGVLTSAGKAITTPVPVQLLQNGVRIAATTSGADGVYTFPGVAAGTYTVEIGRYPDSGTPTATTAPVPIAGRTPTPSPTPSPPVTPSPSAAPAAGGGGAVTLLPVLHTSDAYLPTSENVLVPSVLGEVEADAALTAAGRITGMVGGRAGVPTQVVVEDFASRQIIRSTQVDVTTGRYVIGGLDPGARYRVYAIDRPADPTQAHYGDATAVAETTPPDTDLSLVTPALTLSGTIADTTSGSVVVGNPAAFSRSAVTDEGGTYSVAGLVPAVYPVTVGSPGRITAKPVAVDVTASLTQNLTTGPKPATYKAWFISAGSGMEHVSGTASSADGSTVKIGPVLANGNALVPDLAPGTYHYDGASFVGTVPVEDGPWWFGPPAGTFTLRDGATTDVGPVVLHVFAH